MQKIQYSMRDMRDKIVHYRRSRYFVPHVMLRGREHKSCARCCSLKPLEEFGPALTEDGLSNACNDCHTRVRTLQGDQADER